MFPAVIKKYGNRRLYDSDGSRYVTLDELDQKIRSGRDVRVVDAKSGQDLTQATLTQILIEGRGAAGLLPVGFLTQVLRLSDESLAEFLGRHLTAALDQYLMTPADGEAPPLSTTDPAAAPGAPAESEVAALRRELEELRSSLQRKVGGGPDGEAAGGSPVGPLDQTRRNGR